jgi:hypothetical protein
MLPAMIEPKQATPLERVVADILAKPQLLPA